MYSLGAKGSITVAGAVGDNSLSVRWLAVTRGTGTYRNAIGVARLTDFASAATTLKFYLIR